MEKPWTQYARLLNIKIVLTAKKDRLILSVVSILHSLSTPFLAKKRIIFPFPVFYDSAFCVSIGLERMKCNTA